MKKMRLYTFLDINRWAFNMILEEERLQQFIYNSHKIKTGPTTISNYDEFRQRNVYFLLVH